ncbi:MAG: prolipoprotein diacylglyceryl transferase family protein, partial [Bacteroidota bacterium]
SLVRIRTEERPLFMNYLMLATAFRISVEFLRLQPRILKDLSEAQLTAVVLFVAGFAGMKYFEGKGQKKEAVA